MWRESRIFVALTVLLCFEGSPSLSFGKDSPHNLVENPGFEALDDQGRLPLGWRRESPREEIAPDFGMDSGVTHSGRYAARLTAKGMQGTLGYWAMTVPGLHGSAGLASDAPISGNTIESAEFFSNKAYRFRCYFRTQGVDSIHKSISIKARWKDSKGQELFGEYVSSYTQQGEWYKAERVLIAPLLARSVDLELGLQWTPSGTVWWDDVSFEEVPTVPERKIKVATISYIPMMPSTPEKNLEFFAEKIAEAGKAGADVICLGEEITVVATDKNSIDVAETIPGPTSQVLGQVARKYHMYVIAGIIEREGNLIFNTALVIDRQGNVLGKYRKTHLPESEVMAGVTPGNTYPVFKTDFGTIGLETCYDNFFPEVARSLALGGAEIIFLPIWGDTRANGYIWDIVARARAIDNSVFLVASNYSNTRSLIIDPDGRILADTGGTSGTAMAEIDLDARTIVRWLSFHGFGEWKYLYPAERRTDTYGPLLGSSLH